jgi:hypothetical protein
MRRVHTYPFQPSVFVCDHMEHTDWYTDYLVSLTSYQSTRDIVIKLHSFQPVKRLNARMPSSGRFLIQGFVDYGAFCGDLDHFHVFYLLDIACLCSGLSVLALILLDSR